MLGELNTNFALVTDFTGNVKREFNYRAALGVISVSDVAAITHWAPEGSVQLSGRRQ